MANLNATTGALSSGPVREIGIQTRSVTGTMPDGNRYESTLERDFMLLMQFDAAVDVYTPQPLTLKFRGSDGKIHRYTPDALIEWRPGRTHDVRPLLVEVKYREAFKGDWRRWRVQARAAQEFASDRGWVFQVYTERQIRTPMLDNVTFLLPYLQRPGSPEIEQWLLTRLNELMESTPRDLITSLYRDKWNQAKLIPILWRLVAERSIGFDIMEPLTMTTPIWSSRG